MSVETILDILYHVCFGVILIPLWIGFRHWSKLTVADKWIIGLLTSLLLFEVLADILRFNRVRNHFLYYFQTISVLWCGSLYYTRIRKWEWWPLLIALVVSALIPAEVICWVGFNYINSSTLALSKLILAVYAFDSLRRLIDDQTNVSLRTNPLLYQHAAFLIYGFFSAGTMYFRNYFIETSLDLYFFFDTLTVMISAVAFALFAKGFTHQIYAFTKPYNPL
ncbi:hypothetical protein GCM10028807_42050 [Spirosoma daeguense]